MNSNMCIVKHTLNTVYVLVDLFLCATPIRILHLIYPVVFGFVYSVFNSIYFLSDNTGHNDKAYTYKVMHWTEEPVKAVLMSAVGLLVSALVQVGLWSFYEFRVAVYNKCTQTHTNTSEATIDDDCATVRVTSSSHQSTSGVNNMFKKKSGSFKSARSTNDTIVTSLAESEHMLPSDKPNIDFTDHSKLFVVMETGLLPHEDATDVTEEDENAQVTINQLESSQMC